MAKEYTICVGTIGTGVWRSTDGGATWARIRGNPFPGPFGIPLEGPVRALTVYPDNPHRILAGSDRGVLRSEDNGENWVQLDSRPSPTEGMQIWSVAIDPQETKTIHIGVKPGGVFRSRDGGLLWQKLRVEIADWCEPVGPPRVTAVVIDPLDHRSVWAGIEADGVRRSLDGGETWTRVASHLTDDIHGMAMSGGDSKRAYFSSPDEIFYTEDTGESWQSLVKTEQFPMNYFRDIAVNPSDPRVIFVATGVAAIGNTGSVERSRDGGKTWEDLQLPQEPNSTMWKIALNQADPDRVLAGTLFGEVYTSGDGGDSWQKIKQEFGELRSLAWMPN